jgi:hypothetical protein
MNTFRKAWNNSSMLIALNLRDSDDKCSVFYLRDYSKTRKPDDDTRTYVLETDNLKVKYDWVKFLIIVLFPILTTNLNVLCVYNFKMLI